MPAASAPEWPTLDNDPALLDRGTWAYQLVHGPIEDVADAQLVSAIVAKAQGFPALLYSFGRADRVTFIFDRNGGRAAVLAMDGLVITTGRSWWRAHTRFGGDA